MGHYQQEALLPKEIKLYLDEPYLALFIEEAAREGRTLQGHARRVVEDHTMKIRKPSPKPKRFVAGQVYNDKTGQFENIE